MRIVATLAANGYTTVRRWAGDHSGHPPDCFLLWAWIELLTDANRSRLQLQTGALGLNK